MDTISERSKRSKRLTALADLAAGCRCVADIGTDHAYLPIYMVENGMAERAIACDIKKGPLAKAKANILAAGLNAKIETRLGSGMLPLEQGQCDCIVIAGMGGKLIISILDEGRSLLSDVDRLIVQPQRDAPEVRRTLHRLGFKIIDEKMLIEEGLFYNIMLAQKGKEDYTELEYTFGKLLLEKRSPALKEYIELNIEKLEKISEVIIEGSGRGSKRLDELREDIKLQREALKWF